MFKTILNITRRKYIDKGKVIQVCFAIALLSLFAACTDKDIETPGENDGALGNYDGVALTFSMYLNPSSSTRAMEYEEGNIDDYINVEDFLQILFLDTQGNFLFEATKYEPVASVDHAGQWDITVYLSDYKDCNDVEIPLSVLKEALESDFKIAVLANWTDSNEAYKLDWGWTESKLNPDCKNPANINDIHHLKEDSTYSGDKNNSYSFIMKDGKMMGLNTEWVQYRDVDGNEFGSQEKAWHLGTLPNNNPSIGSDACEWIKNNWDPSEDKYDKTSTQHFIYRHYSHLWQLWNFGGSFTGNRLTYDFIRDKEDIFASKWQARNGNEFRDKWLQSDGKVLTKDNENYPEIDGLIVVTNNTEENPTDKTGLVRSYYDSNVGYYGMILPTMNDKAIQLNKNNDEELKISSSEAVEYMKFQVPGTGHLHIFFSSLNSSEATLIVQRGTTHESKYSISGTDIKEIGDDSGEVYEPHHKEAGYKVNLTSEAEDIVLFALKGSVVVYAIEYICDDYLSATDREGIKPDYEHPIPMYGVQEFPGIDAWGSQPIWNLYSHTGKFVSLIRALAKVELYLPKGKEVPHIYLRSMNRKARCEPMDVLSNTGDLWKNHVDEENNCEWFRIQKYGSAYYKDKKDVTSFVNWYSWFYGSWSLWGWTGLGKWESSLDSPQLFNPDVQRSDFCHFIKDSKYNDGTFDRYFLYVPDKSISDPGTPGNLSSTQKVCHIEYRPRDLENYTEFLDDDNCNRIYFTDYSKNNDIKNTLYNEFETQYEKDKNKLDQLWPIMRNHIYRFYVGQGYNPQDIRVKVLPFEETDFAHRETW